jgi:hypothetical protein
VVRNIYGFALHEERVEPLVQEIDGLWRELRVQIEEFVSYLEELGQDFQAISGESGLISSLPIRP